MRTPSSGSSSKRSNYSRTYDFPEEEEFLDSRDYALRGGGAMLPIFLNDLTRPNHRQDLVEVTLELEDDSIVLCSVTPTATANPPADEAAPTGFLGRSMSATSKLCRKFSWLRSTSSRASSEAEDPTISARDARKMTAKLQRTRSSAQQALKGLRFISKTTGASDAEELWKKVESRFESLVKDGLLSREDFGECIGKVQ